MRLTQDCSFQSLPQGTTLHPLQFWSPLSTFPFPLRAALQKLTIHQHPFQFQDPPKERTNTYLFQVLARPFRLQGVTSRRLLCVEVILRAARVPDVSRATSTGEDTLSSVPQLTRLLYRQILPFYFTMIIYFHFHKPVTIHWICVPQGIVVNFSRKQSGSIK